MFMKKDFRYIHTQAGQKGTRTRVQRPQVSQSKMQTNMDNIKTANWANS